MTSSVIKTVDLSGEKLPSKKKKKKKKKPSCSENNEAITFMKNNWL